MKILMSISSFTVEVSMNGISFFPNNDILKIYFFVRLLISSSSSPWVHSKNISSIYLSRKEGLICSMLRIIFSISSINMQVYGGETFASMIVPDTCSLSLELNSKELFFSITFYIWNRSSVARLLSSLCSNLTRKVSIPSPCGILGSNLPTSTENNMVFPCNLPSCLNFLKKL